MNCHSVQSQLAALSAGQLPPMKAAALEQHCAQCPACRREWEAFQSTLQLLSCLAQPLPCEAASDEIWCACADDWFATPAGGRHTAEWSGLSHWAQSQPRWGWVALGSAIVVFGSVWMMAPSNAPNNPQPQFAEAGTLHMFGRPGLEPLNSAAVRVGFQAPPAAASSAVDYHAAMSFDPFVDHVATGLVSSSAEPSLSVAPGAAQTTAPQVTAPQISTPQVPATPSASASR